MRYEHIDRVFVSAHFEYEGDAPYRYRLEIRLTNTKIAGRTVCVVMQNPSYAGVDVADKSVQFMEKIVFEKGLPEFEGVSGLIVVNQFAKVQTTNFQGLPHEIGALNDAAIETAFTESDIVILAWGSANPFSDRKEFVLGLLRKMKNKLVLKTRSHPSRGRYEGFIQPYSLWEKCGPDCPTLLEENPGKK